MELSSFLGNRKVSSNSNTPFTHTTKEPTGKYYINDTDHEKFMTRYSNIVFKAVKDKLVATGLTITERPQKYGPLRVDIDLQASLDQGTNRQYTSDIVDTIIGYYQDVIRSSVKQFEEKLAWCAVLEKSAPRTEAGIVKDGFHLHFPNFICEGWFQDEYARGRVIAKMKETGIWKHTRYLTKDDDMIDTKMFSKLWLMYGSAKSLTAEPFLATRFIDHNLSEITISEMFESELEGKSSKRYPRYYLPRFLSVRNHQAATPLKPDVDIRKVRHSKRAKVLRIDKRRSEDEIRTDYKTIIDGHLMEMIKDSRADNYQEWIEIGWTLFNIGEGDPDFLNLWIDFSKRSPKFQDGECEEKWAGMKLGGITMGTLFFLARNDSPDRWKEYRKSTLTEYIRECLFEAQPTEGDVARVVFKKYEGRFLCADAKHDMWFEYRPEHHRWFELDACISLKKLLGDSKIPDSVICDFINYKAEMVRSQAGADETNRVRLELSEKRCSVIINLLKTVRFQEKLIKMCQIFFHKPDFLKKKDENKMLFGANNGVLDLEMGMFRSGRPDDYITLSCNIDFREFTDDDEDVIDVTSMFEKIFPNKNRREYFFDLLCSCLQGGNANKTFSIHTGSGDNAKSLTFKIIEATFGDYCMNFPRKMLIKGSERGPSGARPELARVRGKRIVTMAEVAKDETLDIGVLKEFTGNDRFFARNLFEKGTDITPMFTLFLQCNEPPKIPGHDDATWNRIKIIDYESKFLINGKKKVGNKIIRVPETEAEQRKQNLYKADLNLSSRVNEIGQIMLYLLFKRYVQKYKKSGGIKEPQEVSMATYTYRQQNDVFSQYLQERIREIHYAEDVPEAERSFMALPEVFVDFLSWYKANYPSEKDKFDKQGICRELSRYIGKSEKKRNTPGWYGYELYSFEEASTNEGADDE